MTFYELNGQGYALIDGQLYVKARPVEHEEEAPDPHADTPEDGKRGRRPKASADKRSGKLGPEAKAAIREEIAAGATDRELAEKYAVSTTAIRWYRTGSKPAKTGRERVQNYQCMKGHRFQSTLEQSKAICPTCREKVFRKIEEGPVEQGVLDHYND